MLKKWTFVFILCFCGSVAIGDGLPKKVLAENIQHVSQKYLKRFNYLRFYLPSNTIPSRPGLWERWFTSKLKYEHQRALAFYLFNMYVTVNSNRQPVPIGPLTLNDLGVLDGFMLCAEPFDFKNALNFYQKNHTEVHAWLDRFFSAHSFPWPQPTEQKYERWISLLEKQPLSRSQAAYLWPIPNLLKAEIPQETVDWTSPLLKQSIRQGKQTVVLYDKPAPSLEDLDTHLAPKHSQRERTYRWAADECSYMSYLIAKRLTAQVLQHTQAGGIARIYTLTAYPTQGEFLIPAQGTRFTLANGQIAPRWRYHTVVLAIIPHNHSYIPVVLDTFLGGTRPLTTGEWLSHFSANTLFTATPFRPNQITENALRIPDKILGKAVWFNKQEYLPAPILE